MSSLCTIFQGPRTAYCWTDAPPNALAEARSVIFDVHPPPVDILWTPFDSTWYPWTTSSETDLKRRLEDDLAPPIVWWTERAQTAEEILSRLHVPYTVHPVHVPTPTRTPEVILTRPWPDAWELMRELRAHGIAALPFPVITFVPGDPPDPGWQSADRAWDWVVLTSPRGVEFLRDWIERYPWLGSVLRTARWAVIGPATAHALRTMGVATVWMPAHTYQAEGLIELFRQHDIRNRRILLARTYGRSVLRVALQDMGAHVTEWILYRTVAYPQDRLQWLRPWLTPARWVVFTSPSTVRAFLAFLQSVGMPFSYRVITIGPITSRAVRAHSISVDRESVRADRSTLIATITETVHA